jgi:prepilin-type N-terminal cleavage/methylation domain-containing protein
MRKLKQSGFTLAEILVVVGIIGVLSAIMTTAGIRVVHYSKVSSCMSNLRQIGLAADMYVSDHDGYWPPYAIEYISSDAVAGAKAFKLAVLPYGATDDIFYCPLDPFARKTHEVGGGRI